MAITEEQRQAERPHLSHTQLEMYWRCAEQYRRTYIEGERLPPGIALIQGKSVHAGAEHNFRQKILSHRDLPRSEIIDVAMDAFETGIAGGYVLDSDESARGPSIVIGEAKDMARRLADLHAEQQAPEYQPTVVEHKATVALNGASHDLVAIIDLVDDEERLTDIKTAKRSMAQAAIDTSTQLTIYSAAWQSESGRLPAEVRFDTLVKTKTPKRQLLRSRRTMKDIEILANRINVTLAAINAGLFPPCPTGSWCCSPKWCGYFMAGCPYVNAERVAAAHN